MKDLFYRGRFILLAAIAGLLFGASYADAAKCELSPKKIDSMKRSYQRDASNADWLFSRTQEQGYYARLRPKMVEVDGKKKKVWTFEPNDPNLKAFKQIVRKQPEKLNSELPYRGVAELGDKKYAFLLDAAPEADGQGYGLLYFDLNGNGDLTDDGGPIESEQTRKARERLEAEKKKAEEEKKAKAIAEEDGEKTSDKKDENKTKPKKKKTSSRIRATYSYRGSSRHQFPPVDLKIEVGGKKVDYRFFFSAYSYLRSSSGYLNAWLNAGTYYEGQIELNGRKQRIVLVDYNSNGRFDDRTTINEVHRGPKGPARYYPERGDIMFLDPKPVRGSSRLRDMSSLDFRHDIEKLLRIDENYFDLKVAAAGDAVSIEPTEVAMGYVTSPNAKYDVTLHGELGLLTISGEANQPVAVPEGEWKLVRCAIDLTESEAIKAEKKEEERKKAEEKKADEKEAAKAKPDDPEASAMLEAIKKALAKRKAKNPSTASARRSVRRSKRFISTATGTTLGKPITVAKGKTIVLPFGPPYRPVVEPSYYYKSRDSLYLGLEIYGSGGEVLTGLTVNSGRPPKPRFRILGPDDEVVIQGHFGYG